MEKNMVYELAKTLQHTEGVEKEFLEMSASLRDAIEKNYVQKVFLAARDQKDMALSHPPKEVALLKAIAPFLGDGGREQLQQVTRSLLFLHTLRGINNSIDSLIGDGSLIAARSSEAEAVPLSPQSAKMAGLLLALAVTEDI